MKMPVVLLQGLVILLALALHATPAHAAIVQVTLHPDSAIVEERVQGQTSETPAGPALTMLLPRSANPAGLKARAVTPGLLVAGVSWREVEGPAQARVIELRRRLDAARTAHDGVKAKTEALHGQANFWRGLRMEGAPTPEAAGKLAARLAEGLETALTRQAAARVELEKALKAMHLAQEELDRAQAEDGLAWEVVLTLGGPAQRAEVLVTYEVGGCGWTPAWRVEALPGKGQVALTMEAEIVQSSGRTWDAPLRLATVPPVSRIDPPALPEWIIQPRPEAAPLTATRAMKAMGEAMAPQPAPMQDNAPRADYGAYAAYDLGRRSLEPGRAVRLPVLTHAANAEFVHLVRPSRGPEAWLRGLVTLNEAIDLPQGPALFLVDGALAGEGAFGLQGREAEIFFGVDPLLRCTARNQSKGSGERGVFSKSQTHRWAWTFELVNSRKTPVKVRVEEPLPQPRDQRIELTLTAKPETASRDKGLAVWELEMPASGSSVVAWEVGLTAPADLRLDLGWR